MRTIIVILFIPFVVTSCTQNNEKEGRFTEGFPTKQPIIGPTWESQLVIYTCESDFELPVSYLTLESGEQFAAIYYQGNLSMMRKWPAASGVRYISIDEQNSFRWHTKGGEGILTWLAADHTAEVKTLLRGCKVVEDR